MKHPPIFPLFLVLALSACSASQGDRGYVGHADGVLSGEVVGGRQASEKQFETASKFILVLPAGAGPLNSLVEKPYANGWRQSMSLDSKKVAGDWNDLAIDIRFEEGGRAGAKIPMGPPSQDGVKREILARFPGTPMHIVGRPMSNALGPFGLAVGAAGNIRCAFAWQWVEDLRGSRSGEIGGLLLSKATPASIRMRLCRPGVTADQLASWFEQLTLADLSVLDRITAEWKQGSAVADAASPAATSSASASSSAAVAAAPTAVAGAEVVGGNTLETSLVGQRAASTKVASVASIKVATAAPQRRRHYAAAARRTASRAPQQETVEPAAVVAPPSTNLQPQGGRYLAPVGASTAQYGAPQPSGGAGFGQAHLDPGLPAQAYRGPAGSTSRATVATGVVPGPRYLGSVDGTGQ